MDYQKPERRDATDAFRVKNTIYAMATLGLDG
jgi:hypothetical protein